MPCCEVIRPTLCNPRSISGFALTMHGWRCRYADLLSTDCSPIPRISRTVIPSRHKLLVATCRHCPIFYN